MTSTLQLSAASTQYVRVPVRSTAGGTAVDPTGDTVYLAFIEDEEVHPGDDDWHEGSWETAGATYMARCLVGPQNEGVVLAAGVYVVWVKVSDDPEVPVLVGGKLRIVDGAYR